jgi:hypothetical protein
MLRGRGRQRISKIWENFQLLWVCGRGRNSIRPRRFMTTSQTPLAELIDKTNTLFGLGFLLVECVAKDSYQSEIQVGP